VQTLFRFRADDRHVSHDKEHRRAAAAISPTTLLSGSANEIPSGVYEFGRMLKCTSLVNVFHIALAVPKLRQAPAILNTQYFDFDLRTSEVGFVEGKVALRQFTLSKGDEAFPFTRAYNIMDRHSITAFPTSDLNIRGCNQKYPE
jgi:hypothetical protein